MPPVHERCSNAAGPRVAAAPHHVAASRRSSRPRQSAGTVAAAQEGAGGADLTQAGAERLQEFCNTFPDLSEEVLASLIGINPALVLQDPAQVRSKLDALAQAAGVPLIKAALLAAKVPAALDRPAADVAAKIAATASEVGISAEAQVDLYVAQPAMWQVNQPALIRDRLDTLATRLGVPLAAAAELVGRQPMLLAIAPPTIANTLSGVGECLGLGWQEAADLVAAMPVVLALDKGLMRLSVSGVSAATGVPVASLLRLLTRCLGLVSVPTELLSSSIEVLAADLGVAPEGIVALMTQQPTLLCTQPATLQGALDTVSSALAIERGAALGVLVQQPALLYDFTLETAASRIEALAATFNTSQDAMRAAAAAQPALLVVAPATIRSATSLLGSRMGASLAACLDLLVSDPGSFVLASYGEGLMEAWCARLGLEPEAVGALLGAQPALLEMTPNTVKARLESLVALFQVPLEIAAQLAMKQPALLAIPPNATITRAKNLSLSLRCTMSTASSTIAKEPALLAVLAVHATEMREFMDNASEVGAIYEFYTMDWLQRQAKELQPVRMTSFAGMQR